jgi:hypothetical protein
MTTASLMLETAAEVSCRMEWGFLPLMNLLLWLNRVPIAER